MATQLVGSATLWAVEEPGVQLDTDRLMVSVLSGDQLIIERDSGMDSEKLLMGMQVGDRIMTEAGRVAEVLIGDRTVVTLDRETPGQVVAIGLDQITIQVGKGRVCDSMG